MRASITNIQHFSVGDGDGIRTTVFFAGCNLRCPWCHNPETVYKGGKAVDINDIVSEVMDDRDFYIESGGGVTLSGGECMLQADAVGELAKRLKQNGVSVLIDTAGCVPYDSFEKVNPFVDGYLFDIKTWSDAEFLRVCGGKLELVFDNLKRLLKTDKTVRVRIPLIPRFNIDSTQKMCETLMAIGVKSVDLLPFHRLGSSKYKQLGLDYAYADTQPINEQTLTQIQNEYSKYFKVHREDK